MPSPTPEKCHVLQYYTGWEPGTLLFIVLYKVCVQSLLMSRINLALAFLVTSLSDEASPRNLPIGALSTVWDFLKPPSELTGIKTAYKNCCSKKTVVWSTKYQVVLRLEYESLYCLFLCTPLLAKGKLHRGHRNDSDKREIWKKSSCSFHTRGFDHS